MDAATNRLSTSVQPPLLTYDAAGNLTAGHGLTHTWTTVGQVLTTTGTGINRSFAATADGERIVERNTLDSTRTLWIRDLSGKVLREYTRSSGGTWSWSKDYVHRDGLHVATVTSSATRHVHLDHLGTLRRVTDTQATPQLVATATRDYYPFGLEATTTTDPERMRFTGHERDTATGLDYMHARYYSPTVARFVSVDPGRDTDPLTPQSWNLYGYARANPVKYVDPDGEAIVVATRAGTCADEARQQAMAAVMSIGPMPLGIAAAAGQATAQGVFRLPNFVRGKQVERLLARAGGALASNFPTIDRFFKGVATSVKSIDLTAKTYQSIERLTSRITGYIDQLAAFRGAKHAGAAVGEAGQPITKKVLELAVQEGAATPAQTQALEKLVKYGDTVGVEVKLVEIAK